MGGISYGKSNQSSGTSIIKGLEPFLQQYGQLFQQAMPYFGQALAGSQQGQIPLDQLLGPALGLLGPIASSYQSGLQNGFMPNVLQGVESQLLPALERSFSRGRDSLLQEAGMRGTLNGTGTVQQVADLRGGLESGLLQQLAGIQGNLAQGAQQAQYGLASGGMGNLIQMLGQALQQSQFGAQLPLQALGLTTGAINSIPTGGWGRGSSKNAGVNIGGSLIKP